MNAERSQAIIIAEPGDALTIVCGISLLERLLRQLQRLDIRQVTVFSSAPDPIAAHVAQPSWARANIAVLVQESEFAGAIPPTTDFAEHVLFVACGCYDSRLLKALLALKQPSILLDSSPPGKLQPLIATAHHIAGGYWCGAALVDRNWLATDVASIRQRLFEAAETRATYVLDVRELASYVPSMRRHIRPFWFPPPSGPQIARAECLLLDAAQNGTLDLPAKLHAPIETWIIARLCRTGITPIQITLFTACISAVVALLFSVGWLRMGTALALIVGILDGLDGKQARVKVETTELGKREHVLDYVLELWWWTALAYYFHAVAQVRNAFTLLGLLVGADVVDQLARRAAKTRIGRNLDDYGPLDRFVRLIGGRRNIYIWIFAIGLLLSAADNAFVVLCWWGVVTAAVHLLRAVWISRHAATARTEGAAH